MLRIRTSGSVDTCSAILALGIPSAHWGVSTGVQWRIKSRLTQHEGVRNTQTEYFRHKSTSWRIFGLASIGDSGD